MTLKIVTPPNVEPVSVAEAKVLCRVDSDITFDDALIATLIAAAREECEHLTGRALITQTWERVLDAFPCGGILLGMGLVQSIAQVSYVDSTGVTQIMSSADYVLDATNEQRPYLLPVDGVSWPDTYDTANAVSVRFVAGFGSAHTDVPQSLRTWILLRVAGMYPGGDGADHAAKMAQLVSAQLDRWRVYGS